MKDGKTPYSRHRGREWRVSLPPFGETIEFLKRGHKFEARWQQGIFLGVKDSTTEKIVGNALGVFTVQSIRRKSEKIGTTWKRSGQLLGSHGILRRPEMKYQKDLVQQSWMGNLQNLWHSQ